VIARDRLDRDSNLGDHGDLGDVLLASRIFTKDRLRSSSSVSPLWAIASGSVIAPQFQARRK
jgi:hypothetical protein